MMWAIWSKYNSLLLLFYVLTSILLLSAFGYTRTWYVKPDQTGDAPTIEAAIDSAYTGDTILVAPGYYIENTLYIYKDLHLISESGAQVTVIKMLWFFDFNLNVMILEGLSSNSSVVGFKLTGGRGSPLNAGAGIDLRYSSSFISENIIYDNETQIGGGIYCIGGSPVIRIVLSGLQTVVSVFSRPSKTIQ